MFYTMYVLDKHIEMTNVKFSDYIVTRRLVTFVVILRGRRNGV